MPWSCSTVRYLSHRVLSCTIKGLSVCKVQRAAYLSLSVAENLWLVSRRDENHRFCTVVRSTLVVMDELYMYWASSLYRPAENKHDVGKYFARSFADVGRSQACACYAQTSCGGELEVLSISEARPYKAISSTIIMNVRYLESSFKHVLYNADYQDGVISASLNIYTISRLFC